jgi:hypothetical protein
MFKTFRMRTLVVNMATLASICLFPLSVRADANSSVLALIEQHTKGTLAAVNDLPTYLASLAKLSLSWLAEDDSKQSASMQASFGQLTNSMAANTTLQNNIQQQLLSGFFGSGVTRADVPYANDLTYSTLIGKPYFSPDPRDSENNKVDSALNYIKNAAGLSMTHIAPGKNWQGSAQAQQKYSSFYSTISAVQTFNAYVLSQYYAEAKNGNKVSNTQASLIQQASAADWFTTIATEKLGVVLRQLLMYNSQTYVLMTQLLQTQKQLLASQAMNNTLLIMGNLYTESMLYNKANNIQQAP